MLLIILVWLIIIDTDSLQFINWVLQSVLLSNGITVILLIKLIIWQLLRRGRVLGLTIHSQLLSIILFIFLTILLTDAAFILFFVAIFFFFLGFLLNFVNARTDEAESYVPLTVIFPFIY